MRPRRAFYVGRAGSCYHSTSGCQALGTAAVNHEIRALTTVEVRAAELRPCLLCRPPLVTMRVVTA